MWRFRGAFVVLIGLSLVPLTGAEGVGGQSRPVTPEDLWHVKRLGPPALSPNGKWVAIEVTTFNIEQNGSVSDLWFLSADGLTRKKVESEHDNNSSPVWSPDGKQIAFVGKSEGKIGQIYLASPDNLKPRPLSKLPMSPSSLKWSPDGRWIFCIVQNWPEVGSDAEYQNRLEQSKKNKVKALVIDDAMYRVWDKWIADGKRPVLMAVSVKSGKHQYLFAGLNKFLPIHGASARSYDIAPDGKELCFVSETTKELGTDYNYDLYTLRLDAPAQLRNITTDNPANDDSPVYSPDGKFIAFTRQTIKFFYADRARLMLHDRQTGQNRELSGKLDRSCEAPRWAADSSAIFCSVEMDGYHKLVKISRNGESLTPATEGHSDSSLDISRDGRHAVFLRTNFNLPAALYFTSTKFDGDARQIDTFNKELVAQWQLGKVESLTFKGADNDDVQMWVVYPPNFDFQKKWPLLQMVHGGPHNAITTGFHYRWNPHVFAARGYVVGIVNFHGSSGFGQKFTDSLQGDMAGKPFIDIMKATDLLESKPFIDSKRTTAAGASYGGYMMAWLNGHTDRFQALVCHAGVYNAHGMMASDLVRGRERAWGAFPWGDITKIDRQSPQRFAAHFKTPTLIMHGEKDYRVPVTQGLEYYNTLRLKGVPTRLVYFPDENHWILKPQNSLLWHREFFGWLERFVGSGPTKE